MAYLFSYGTLQQSDIQKALFDGELKGWPDVLLGFELSGIKAYGQYPIIMKAIDPFATVSGMAYEISEYALEQVDAYEGEEYHRILAKLKSGKEAWVYIAK